MAEGGFCGLELIEKNVCIRDQLLTKKNQTEGEREFLKFFDLIECFLFVFEIGRLRFDVYSFIMGENKLKILFLVEIKRETERSTGQIDFFFF